MQPLLETFHYLAVTKIKCIFGKHIYIETIQTTQVVSLGYMRNKWDIYLGYILK